MSEKKWDTVRLYAIRDQIARGEEISTEDKEYTQEWFEAMKPNLAAFTEAMKQFADAYIKAAARLGRQLREGVTPQ